MQKPTLLVPVPDPNPCRGSEPGKAFHWTNALAEFYQVHVICFRSAAEICVTSGRCKDWEFHPVDMEFKKSSGILHYHAYHQWCRHLIPKCLELIPIIRPVGLHHTIMGSFRMMPSYHHLPIPYTLGPLGGGETAPWHLLRKSSMPLSAFAKEMLRPALNYACLLNPQVRQVIQKAQIVLATTRETEGLLKWAGARKTAVVFPDAIDLSHLPADPLLARKRQLEELRGNFRCIWSGRFLWWKGGQLALRFVRRLREAGCDASLDIYSEGAGMDQLKTMAQKLGLGTHARFNGMVTRDQLLQAYLRAHLFVYPTLHDSSSSAIPEAYGTGLPSMTLALGGTRTAADPKAGLNVTPRDIESWFVDGVGLVKNWIKNPDTWLESCHAALEKARTFSAPNLIVSVRRHLRPCFARSNTTTPDGVGCEAE
jgi:glycosyltransferase involved in cell wall biosynthesis